MFDNYVIEVRSDPGARAVQAGIVVRDGARFRFFAAIDALFSLERRLFKNPKAAEEAAQRQLAASRAQRSSLQL
jgi:hypothetical protein